MPSSANLSFIFALLRTHRTCSSVRCGKPTRPAKLCARSWTCSSGLQKNCGGAGRDATHARYRAASFSSGRSARTSDVWTWAVASLYQRGSRPHEGQLGVRLAKSSKRSRTTVTSARPRTYRVKSDGRLSTSRSTGRSNSWVLLSPGSGRQWTVRESSGRTLIDETPRRCGMRSPAGGQVAQHVVELPFAGARGQVRAVHDVVQLALVEAGLLHAECVGELATVTWVDRHVCCEVDRQIVRCQSDPCHALEDRPEVWFHPALEDEEATVGHLLACRTGEQRGE